MVDIFLSYARSDQQRIKPLIAGLQAEGWVVFWDLMIPAGKTWRQHIVRHLDEARCVVVAWSKTSIESEWVIEEADQGKRKGILLPLLLDAVEPPIGFRMIQAASLVQWPGDLGAPEWLGLLTNIRDLLRTQTPESLNQQQPEDILLDHFDDQIEAAVEMKGGRVALAPSDVSVPRQNRFRKWVIGLSIATLLLLTVFGWFLKGTVLAPMTSKSNEPSALATSPIAVPFNPSGPSQLSKEKQELENKVQTPSEQLSNAAKTNNETKIQGLKSKTDATHNTRIAMPDSQSTASSLPSSGLDAQQKSREKVEIDFKDTKKATDAEKKEKAKVARSLERYSKEARTLSGDNDLSIAEKEKRIKQLKQQIKDNLQLDEQAKPDLDNVNKFRYQQSQSSVELDSEIKKKEKVLEELQKQNKALAELEKRL